MTMSGSFFDDYLPGVSSDELKSMVRMWGGRTQMRKAECIEYICEGLRDPNRVRTAIAGLKPVEQCALALAKQAGGRIQSQVLAAALCASGWVKRGSRQWGRLDGSLIHDLQRRGLFLEEHSHGLGYYLDSYGPGAWLFSDARLLEQIGYPVFRPLDIVPDVMPSASVYRRPPSVVLDIMGVLNAIERIGGLGVTQTGKMRVRDLRKFEHEVIKGGDSSSNRQFALPNPADAWVNALIGSNLVSLEGVVWRPVGSLDELAAKSYADQVRPILYGFAGATEWSESVAVYSYSTRRLPLFRWALLVALAALSIEGNPFYRIHDLGWALFERIGEAFSLGYLPYPPYQGNKSAQEFRQEQAVWRGKLRQGWKAQEQEWMTSALATWLYQLGIVELGLDGHLPVSVRLTGLGMALLHPEMEPEAADQSEGAAWVIQPNFDLVVYLDRASSEQLAFLERHAERVQAQQHTANYRLTRNAVYGGLESGTSLDDILATLRQGSSQALPQNIEVEIREWAALREKVTLYRRARLLEFDDADARQAAIEGGVSGTPIGDRYLQLATDSQEPARVLVTDYDRPLPRCVAVGEDGHLRVASPRPDLAIAAQLDDWAEPLPPDEWQLTARSVAAPVRAKRRIGELLDLLDQRSRRRVPQLLRVALRAWAGEPPTVHLETVTVLKCPTPEVFEAVKNSPRLGCYLRGVLAPDLLLVDTDQVGALMALLAWAGIKRIDRMPTMGD